MSHEDTAVEFMGFTPLQQPGCSVVYGQKPLLRGILVASRLGRRRAPGLDESFVGGVPGRSIWFAPLPRELPALRRLLPHACCYLLPGVSFAPTAATWSLPTGYSATRAC